MKLAAPAIIAAHVATLPTLTSWAAADGRPAVSVYEGAALRRDDVREWVTVGFVAGVTEPTVQFEPVPAAQGQQNREAGTVLSQLVTAQADVPTARDRVFALLADWVGWLGGDRTLGGSLQQGSQAHLLADVTLATTRAGATASAVVTVTYTAVTYG
jgi:hypothetical protein